MYSLFPSAVCRRVMRAQTCSRATELVPPSSFCNAKLWANFTGDKNMDTQQINYPTVEASHAPTPTATLTSSTSDLLPLPVPSGADYTAICGLSQVPFEADNLIIFEDRHLWTFPQPQNYNEALTYGPHQSKPLP